MTTQLRTNHFHRIGGATAAAFGLLLAPLAAHAQVSLNFAPAAQTVSAGSAVTFSGSITNTSTGGLYLTGDTFSLNGLGLTVDDTLFFNDTATPIFLASGASFPVSGTAGLFTVAADSTAVPGSADFGTFNITGGTTSSAAGTIGSQTFAVLVAPVPEAATSLSLGLLLLGGAGALAFRRRKPAAAV